MSYLKQPLVERVARLSTTEAYFSPAVAEAMRLAELFDDIKPEQFWVPTSDTLEAFQPENANRMLAKISQ